MIVSVGFCHSIVSVTNICYHLRFGIDPCIHAFIRATWQGYYMGPWKSWNKVPEERKDSWWQTFVVIKNFIFF